MQKHTHKHSHNHAHEHAHGHHHEHEHGMGHNHAQEVNADNEKIVLIAFLIIAGFMVVEIIGGVISGSLALLADAGHMLTDALALFLSWAAFKFGRKKADEMRTYGYARFEVLAGFINAITLFLIVFWIIYEAWQRFSNPQPIMSTPMLVVAILGLIVNIAVLMILLKADKEHVNIKGAILHVMGDLLGSLGAIIAASVVMLTNWTPIDPILSILVSLLIIKSAWGLLKKSLHILLEGAPENAKPEKIKECLLHKIQGIKKVAHIHVWQITSSQTLATLHIQPENDENAREITRQAAKTINDVFNIKHTTIEIIWNDEQNIDNCENCTV